MRHWIAIACWFACGAGVPVDAIENEVIQEIEIDDYDREHWAFQPIVAPAVPAVKHTAWPQTSIDHFILALLESKSITPAPMADRPTLLRRLSVDLTGLPPTPQQLDDFLSDPKPDAYRRVVDRLLSSPQYGQRWGQHWLDLARFAETDGFEHDKVRPTAWQYRDWVIDAFASDMPYDRFVTLQLAGDVVEPGDAAAEVATAFCLSGPDMPDINSMEERKHVLMNEVTSSVSAVLLSLQLGCAQCHDHKFDAISQADFYRLRAFFEPAVKLTRNESVTTLQPTADPEAVGRFFSRGDWRRPVATVPAAFPRIANLQQQTVDSEDPGQKRFELARWLTDPGHPLTSRSIVNRVWQYHFGRGFSSTPSDFGVMGDDPTHPELLDHLASRLIERGWSLKDLHRQIVLSSVYQTTSIPPDQPQLAEQWQRAVQADPRNRWLARFPRRRLDAESIRDAMFAVSGTLHLQAGGPGVLPPLPEELTQTLLKGQWVTSENEADHYRRSIYIFARRNFRYPLLATFDRPIANASCAVRHQSTTAIQSLLLFNSEMTLDASQRLAQDIQRSHPDPISQATAVYRRVLCRQPDDQQVNQCVEFLQTQSELLQQQGNKEPKLDALVDLSRAMLNSNAFLYVD